MRLLKTAVSLTAVLAVCLAMLMPLVLLTPPRDSEVWLFQTIFEMQDQQRFLPVLNGKQLPGTMPLTLAGLSLLPIRDITTTRLVSCVLGCISIVTVFLYSLALFDLASAIVTAILTMTSLGFIVLFGTLNLAALPVFLAAGAFGLFSVVYLKRMHTLWYILSYVLAAIATVTGGYFFPTFFLMGALLLIALDLAPSEFFSIHLVAGALIIASLIIASWAVFRIASGYGFAAAAISQGGHLGLWRGMGALLTYASPWIFLVIPAWLYGGGPSDQDSWRKLLPMRIAVVLGFFMLWISSSSLPQYAMILVPFEATLIGSWIANSMFRGEQPGRLGSAMMTLSGITVFVLALVFILLPMPTVWAISTEQLIAVAGFIVSALTFVYLAARKKMIAQFILIVICATFVVWCITILSPEAQWNRKIAFIEGLSRNSPLLVYDDDLIMRGYLSALGSHPFVVERAVVPLADTAFLAVSTSDLNGLVDELKGHMHPVIVDSYRSENTYALVMISPRRSSE